MGLEGASAVAFLADMSQVTVFWVVQQSWVLLQALPGTDGIGLGSATSRLPAGSALQSCLGAPGNGMCLLLLPGLCLEKTSGKILLRKVCQGKKLLLTLDEVEDQRGILDYPLFHGGVCGL